MILKTKYIILITIWLLNYLHSHSQIITTPIIKSPEEEFIAVFQKEKLSNPIFLNGNVKEVTKNIVEYITPNRGVTIQENYSYSLNKQNKLLNIQVI